MWEKKDNAGGIHDYLSEYTWSNNCTSPYASGCGPDGTAFTVFLATLNTPPCFAGHCDWRLPTTAGSALGEFTGQAAELESILDPGVVGCGSGSPCVPPAFSNNCTPGCTVANCSCTVSDASYGSGYWSSSLFDLSYDGYPDDHAYAWIVNFFYGEGVANAYTLPARDKGDVSFVRAVRGGL